MAYNEHLHFFEPANLVHHMLSSQFYSMVICRKMEEWQEGGEAVSLQPTVSLQVGRLQTPAQLTFQQQLSTGTVPMAT